MLVVADFPIIPFDLQATVTDANNRTRKVIAFLCPCRNQPPGATGNVVFEDLVFLCESTGFSTGIDIEKLIAVRGILRSEMPGETLYGGLARAGLPDRKSSVAA